MDVGVVGAGPAGSLLSWILASEGAAVTVFDPTHPREKPCGGAVSPAGFSKFDFLDSPTLACKKVDTVTWVSPGNTEVELALDEPIRTFSRLQLDRYILDSAVRSGAQWLKSRVIDIERKDNGWVIRTERETHTFDFLVGADGAHSLVRRKLLGKTPAENLVFAIGYL
ncbi:MAG: NAD(P)/FAD-dependent oxidoreductase, partial [Candidatus Hydrogenedentes bacterium]|nr:NAD(P)/FAD-dependent oxidoreductase [Candidatus Hydrogenedentota bacterium]